MRATEELKTRTNIDRIDVVRLETGDWWLGNGPADGGCFVVIYAATGAARLTSEPAELAEGELAVFAARVRVQVLPGAEIVAVRVPEDAAGVQAPVLRAAVGKVVAAESGTPGLIAHLLRGLATHGRMRTDHPIRLAQHVVGLIAFMCLDASQAQDEWRSSMLHGAIDYIERHLGDVELSPDRIAAAQNISTRTLHRLFEREGTTLGAWIRNRRLEHCREDLADSTHAETSVSAIGARWGLWDAAHFSRLFKSTFGAPPRAFRQRALDGRGGDLVRVSA
ncbi:MAG: helix-turn-helix domain-containing protein [Beutenbergiaceae bacterium]